MCQRLDVGLELTQEKDCKGKVPVIIRDDYKVYLELFENRLWIHTDVHKWTADTKKRYKADLTCLESLVNRPIFALVAESNKKLAKFGKVIGWHNKAEIVCLDGSKASIYSSKE
jgi:hypothetical protein